MRDIRIFSLPVLGLITTGIVSSGLIGLFPPFVRFVAFFLLVSYLGGESIRRLIWARQQHLEWRLPLSVLLGISTFSLLTWVCQLLKAPLATYLVVLQVFCLLLFGVSLFFESRAPSQAADRPRSVLRGPRVLLVGLALLIAVLQFSNPIPPWANTDSYDHIGYIRAIVADGRLDTGGVLAPPGGEGAKGGDPRKGTMHVLLAAGCVLVDLDPAQLWQWAPVVLAPVAVLAFFAFASILLPSVAYAIFALLIFLMFQGGLARHFLGTVGYGQHLSLVYLWVVFVVVLDHGRRPTWRGLLGVLLLVVGGVAVHLDVLLHVALLFLSLTICCRVFNIRLRVIARLAVATATLVAGFLVWKLSTSLTSPNEMHAHPQGLLYFFELGDPHYVSSPVEALQEYGLLFLVGVAMVPALLLVRRHRTYALMSLALSAPPVLFAWNPWVAPLLYERLGYLLHRFLLNVPALVVTALLLGSLVGWARRGLVPHKIIAVILIFAWAKVWLVAAGAWTRDLRSLRPDRPIHRPRDEITQLAEFFERRGAARQTVLSDPLTSYMLSAYAPVRVVAVVHQHANPNDPLVFDRLRATRSVLSPYTLQAQAVGAIRDWNVNYVVLNGTYDEPVREYLAEWDPQAMEDVRSKLGGLDDLLVEVFATDRIAVYRVIPSAETESNWYPSIPFIDASPPVTHCEMTVTPALELTGIRLEPSEVLPGETVKVTATYRKNRDPVSPLPVKLIIRLEDRSYFENARTYPGDKLVRRFLERRRSAFARYRIERKPFDGLYTAEMWPFGRDCWESFEVRLPGNLAEATYDVRVRLVQEPLVPNFAVRDFLYNEDSLSGPRCTQVNVTRFLTR